MVKPINIQAIENGTDTSWETWCKELEAFGAATLDHNGIVKAARKIRPISGWWAQGVAVAYEQHIGRRKPGQTSDGLFSASISRTLPGNQALVYQKWCDFAANLTDIGGVRIVATPTKSETPKWLYWRCKFDDQSSVVMSIMSKDNAKVLIAVEHSTLPLEDQIASTKQAWSALLAACFKPGK